LVASTDQEELLQVCSRILILRDGRVTGAADAALLTPQTLLALCYGEILS
jgi:ABC-type sugar transport system ATPase subunit